MCRHLPNLRVVGLEPQEAPLAEGRRNIAEAGFEKRIELRPQGVEEMTDREEFDLTYFPQTFMPRDVVKRGLQAIRTALRPGGWLLTATLSMPGAGIGILTVTGFVKRSGVAATDCPEEVATMMTDAGFEAVRIVTSQDRGTAGM